MLEHLLPEGFVSNLDKLSSEEIQNCQAIANLSLLLVSRTPLPTSSSSTTTTIPTRTTTTAAARCERDVGEATQAAEPAAS
jgi:hypothetical protein